MVFLLINIKLIKIIKIVEIQLKLELIKIPTKISRKFEFYLDIWSSCNSAYFLSWSSPY